MSSKAIFLDRDGTLVKDPGYISHPDQVKLLPGATEALVQLKELDYKLARYTALVEPAIIVLAAVIVGFVAIALVSAIYGLIGATEL